MFVSQTGGPAGNNRANKHREKVSRVESLREHDSYLMIEHESLFVIVHRLAVFFGTKGGRGGTDVIARYEVVMRRRTGQPKGARGGIVDPVR